MIALSRLLPLRRLFASALFGLALLPGVVAAAPATTAAAAEPVYGARLEGFDYPYPVHQFRFHSQRQDMEMAYLDVAPASGTANGRTVVLLHGKNFCAGTWGPTIAVLSQAGYRVIAPDQIGFCKSSKLEHYQFSFAQLAANTQALLAGLGVHQATLIGHSTGGMLAIRYALSYPQQTEQLVLVDPIGLEDWRAKGVPPVSVDTWYARELQTSAERIRNYERNTYFAGQWSAAYEPPVQMLAGMYRGPDKALVAWNSALLYDMILNQPVYYELGRVQTPTVLMIGDKDNTAIGKEFAPAELRPALGNYPELARQAVATMPHARLVVFSGAGHSPQVQMPELFHAQLLKSLAPDPALVRQLAPSGTLRASINLGNPVLASLDAHGQAVGVSVDLARALAQRLGVPLQLVVGPSAAGSVRNLEQQQADIGFFAIDPKRARDIHFSKPYVLIEGYYAVRSDSPVTSNAQVDQPGVTVAVGQGSAYDLFLSRELKQASLVRTPTSAAVVPTFLERHLEVAAGVRQQLQADAARVGGLRILDQRFMVIRQAMGLPTARGAAAAAYLDAFVDEMTASGMVAAALARHGIDGALVAGPQD